MNEPDPDELVEFLSLLTENAPDGYEPWLFRVEAGSKAPDLQYGSWKDESARLSRHEAVEWMQSGGNVGIAGRPDGPLINVDIDDEDATTIDDLKPTLIARSRSRTGVHAWYFEAPGAEIPNIPTDDAGEVRANWQYVVAPGSYVETDPDDVPEGEREKAGYYTVARADPVTSIRLDELPEVFQDHNEPDPDAQEILTPEEGEFTPDESAGDGSGLFDISARDVVQKEGGSTDPGDRWSALFHRSETGHNMSMSSNGLLHCWRHEVAHNGLQALAVLSDYSGDCADVGTGHNHSGAGTSCLHREDGAHIWHAWKYAKQNGYIPDDDPVPYAALKHLCRGRELCPVSEIPDDYDADDDSGRLPAYAYDGALASIRNHDGLEPGRSTTDELDGDEPKLDAVAEPEPDDGDEPDAPDEQPDTAHTDGGATTADASADVGPRPLENRIRSAIQDAEADVIKQKTARHRIAKAIDDTHHFVYPEESVPGWRSVLHVYDDANGVYEPRGAAFVEQVLELHAGDYVTNQVRNEIVGKIERLNKTDGRLEAEPNRLVVGNGILDLHTGELDDCTPHEYHTTKLEVDWNPDDGEPDAIDDFLHDIVEDDDVDTLYRLIAHTLYREYLGEKAAILIGSGSNGKSMFLSLIESFIGSYNVAHRELQDFDDDGFAANNLQGKLANLATEIGEQAIDNATTFKKLTGRDSIQARVKFEKPIKFENYASLMFATNEMPVFGQDNHAIWRRWVYVDFPYTFDAGDPAAKDPEPERVLKERLFADEEFEALLVRCQREIQRWYEGEPFFADAMDAEAVRDKMKKAAEPIYAFGSTCLEGPDDSDDTVFVQKSVVRAAYKAFADEEDLPRISENEFGKRLLGLRDYAIESGQRRIDGQHTRVYNGIQLSSRGRQVLGIDEPEDEQATVDDGRQPAKPFVMQQARELVEDNGGDPIPREGLEWACAGQIGKATAEHAIDSLLHQGDLYEPQTGKLIPT